LFPLCSLFAASVLYSRVIIYTGELEGCFFEDWE